MCSADENSGSAAWDRTIDVRKRPVWLRGAATIDSSNTNPDMPDEDNSVELELVDGAWRNIAVDVGETKSNAGDWRSTLMSMLNTTQDIDLFDASLPVENAAQLAEAQYQQARVQQICAIWAMPLRSHGLLCSARRSPSFASNLRRKTRHS